MPLHGDRKREYDREYLRKRREEWFKGKVCANCGFDQDLELDHIDPATKVTHRVWSWSSERREAELAKCQPLCRECHRRRTSAQQTIDHPHGTRGRYKKGCRCRPCTDVAVAVANYYRNRRKSSVV